MSNRRTEAENGKREGEYLRTGFGVQNYFSFENNNRKHFLPFFVLLGGGVMNLMHNPNRETTKQITNNPTESQKTKTKMICRKRKRERERD